MIKTQVTQKEIRQGFTNVIAMSYCSAQFLLWYHSPQYYTYSRDYGWKADIYVINEYTAIVTGYAPFGNIHPDYDLVNEFEKKAEKVYHSVTDIDDRKAIINGYLSEFIKAALAKGV